MQLFKRRPLCFFCFLFAVACLLAIKLGSEQKLWTLMALIFVIIVICICVFAIKRARNALLYCLLSLIFMTVGICSSFIGIDLPQRRAEQYIGERSLKMSVLDKEYSSSYSSAYTVRIENVDGEKATVKALLLLNFEVELSVGDIAYVNADVVPIETKAFGISGASVVRESDVLLTCIVDGENCGYVERFDREAPVYKQLLSKNGASAVLSDLKDTISDRAQSLLGATTGSLACGFLLGDTADIPDLVIRDFRRAGVSHLLAVSGMHISILLGAVELLLRRIYVPKLVRCVTVSLLAFILLCLTGFSMSAMRAVLMLWISYLFFLFSEEADAPTVLFMSLFVILLLFPHAVYDIGLWMSFLATLGLVTLYPMASARLPKPSSSNIFARAFQTLSRATVLAVLLTVVANMFLLYIMCTVFGGLSLSAIPANLLLSVLSTVFMLACVAAIALGDIPVVGVAICFLCQKTGDLITLITWTFSSFGWSVVSLRPLFARIIVISFSIILAVFLVIKVKHKWVFAAVPTAFAVAFCACMTVRAATFDTYAVYTVSEENETLCLSDGKTASVVDMSNGAYEHYCDILSDVSESGATEIDTIVFTRITRGHLSTMTYILRNELVRNISIPYPVSTDETDVCLRMAELAKECGVSVTVYGDEPFRLLDGIYLSADTENRLLFIVNGEYMLGYVDVGNEQKLDSYIPLSDVLIFRGEPFDKYSYDIPQNTDVIYSSPTVFDAQKGKIYLENSYVNIYGELKLKIRLE